MDIRQFRASLPPIVRSKHASGGSAPLSGPAPQFSGTPSLPVTGSEVQSYREIDVWTGVFKGSDDTLIPVLDVDYGTSSDVPGPAALEIGWQVMSVDTNVLTQYVRETDAGFKLQIDIGYRSRIGASSWSMLADAQQGILVRAAERCKVSLLPRRGSTASPTTLPDRYIRLAVWGVPTVGARKSHATYSLPTFGVDAMASSLQRIPRLARSVWIHQSWPGAIVPGNTRLILRFAADAVPAYHEELDLSTAELADARLTGIVVPPWASYFSIENLSNVVCAYSISFDLMV